MTILVKIKNPMKSPLKKWGSLDFYYLEILYQSHYLTTQVASFITTESISFNAFN